MSRYEVFQNTLLANMYMRSRTARGETHTEASSLKLPPIKQGDDLILQIDENVRTTGRNLWEYRSTVITPSVLHALFFWWFDMLNAQLLDLAGYRARRHELGLPPDNERYRMWNFSPNPASSKPEDIGRHMAIFASSLAEHMSRSDVHRDLVKFAQLLALADREIDEVIHPWVDGCGRFATALVMWLAARSPAMPLPHFGPPDKHHLASRTLQSHTEYFLRCLSKDV